MSEKKVRPKTIPHSCTQKMSIFQKKKYLTQYMQPLMAKLENYPNGFESNFKSCVTTDES